MAPSDAHRSTSLVADVLARVERDLEAARSTLELAYVHAREQGLPSTGDLYWAESETRDALHRVQAARDCG